MTTWVGLFEINVNKDDPDILVWNGILKENEQVAGKSFRKYAESACKAWPHRWIMVTYTEGEV